MNYKWLFVGIFVLLVFAIINVLGINFNKPIRENSFKKCKKIQKNGFSCTDLLILEPTNGYSGLFIELKIETPFKKNGEIKASKDDHLKNQLEAINKLKEKGYMALFSWNFDMTKDIIDNYLKV